jgi:ubiquinone/menaquinone biosynthesis C-methylase UbiE
MTDRTHVHHEHKGRSSESRLDKAILLEALDIQSGQCVLDAGCGDGYMSKEFSRLVGRGGKVYALESDPERIVTLKEETVGTNIEPILADITTTTTIEESSIDLIYLSNVIHGFANNQLEGFRREVKRLLKPGARLAIVEIDKRETSFGPPMEIRFSPEELRRAIPLAAKATVAINESFYMQVFENAE